MTAATGMRPGRPGGADGYRPTQDTEYRLEKWRAGCQRELSTAEIAHQLRISVATLRRLVSRARERGHPDAVYHPLAYRADDGFSHVVSPQRRAARVRRHRAGDTTRGTLREVNVH